MVALKIQNLSAKNIKKGFVIILASLLIEIITINNTIVTRICNNIGGFATFIY
mgnify:FL=1